MKRLNEHFQTNKNNFFQQIKNNFFRLDFDNFVTASPDAVDQNCVTDQLVVSGGSTIPPICGTNTGQHSELDINQFCTFTI